MLFRSHRAELEQFHERKYNLVRKESGEGGAKLVAGDITAPPISVMGVLMKRWRGPRGETAPPQPAEKRRAGSRG